jgi:prevent-host-death family protein
MKKESVRAVRDRLDEIIKALPRGPVIITRNGRPCAALVAIDEYGDLEALLITHNSRLGALMDRGVAQCGNRSLDEVEQEVAKRERKGKRRAPDVARGDDLRRMGRHRG